MAVLPDGTRLRALLLDLDDTILDNRSGVSVAWDSVADLLTGGHPDLDPGAIRAEIGRVTDWFWSDDRRHREGRLDLVRARGVILGRVLAAFGREDPELVARAARHYEEHRSSTLCLEEGVLEALVRLRRAVPRLGLVTNGASGAQRAKVDRFDLERFFDHVQIEGEFGLGKPDRPVFENAVRALDVEPGLALMAGDNFECDVLGPLEAGLHAAWIDCRERRTPPRPAPRGFLQVRSLVELAELLGC